ncbi:phage tail protein [Paenibacillus radicis (ex Gao et al. 2016)]|uniref:Tail Collar domain-containing protein n=1 Tax=Paenibacillus radicis (ex Gao et al. 2016) TaxID=1737354 RepID=A0A917HNA5_9BACL|nr:tail fiber protein [Paenibacillus radicis (ex Gao et al. 2016)]GGG84188.1 tail Collar domain-containing protein [Paenibacillus radicis (ex Gao et al. 2016)]
MGQPYMGEIKLYTFNFVPRGWAACNGQLLAINQNQALYSLLGTTYGGDGVTNFGLPDLRGKVPIHFGAGFVQGQASGKTAHTLTPQELPLHNHPLQGKATAATSSSPQDAVWAAPAVSAYHTAGNGINAALNAAVTDYVGGNQAHNNMQPYLTLNFCICITGIFPSRD